MKCWLNPELTVYFFIGKINLKNRKKEKSNNDRQQRPLLSVSSLAIARKKIWWGRVGSFCPSTRAD
jgi:hypothetical protein